MDSESDSDDDDYYPPTRVEHAVRTLLNNPQALCAGSTSQFIYYKHNRTLYKLGPFGEMHGIAGTFAYRKRLLEFTRYEDTATMAEEKHFLKNYTIPFVQLDIYHTIVIISHDTNTYDKKKLLIPGNSKISTVPFKIDYLIKEPELLHAYTKDNISDNIFKTRVLTNHVFSDTYKLFSLASKGKLQSSCASKRINTDEDKQYPLVKEPSIVVKDKDGNQRTLNSNEIVDVLSKQQTKISELLKIIKEKDQNT